MRSIKNEKINFMVSHLYGYDEHTNINGKGKGF